jgi:hypothetical protein
MKGKVKMKLYYNNNNHNNNHNNNNNNNNNNINNNNSNLYPTSSCHPKGRPIGVTAIVVVVVVDMCDCYSLDY